MLAGLDLGTTGSKITVYNKNGKLLKKFYKKYNVKRGASSHELNPVELINVVKSLIKDACKEFKIDSIGIDSFGEAFVMLDEDDKPLMNCIICTDSRGEKENQELIKKVGLSKLEKITGLKPDRMYSLPKIMWVKKNYPDLFKKCKHILLIGDYVLYSLTKSLTTDYSLPTRTLMFDQDKFKFSKEILDKVGIDYKLFATPILAGSKSFDVTKEIKKELEIRNNIQICLSGHDQFAVAVGSGIKKVGEAVDGAGTVECITPIFDITKVNVKFLIDNNYAIVPYLKKNQYLTYAFTHTSGVLIDWFMNNFASNIKDPFNTLEKEFSASPTGLLVLPHFAGSATPYMDGNSKGAIVGLTLGTKPSTIYQAILEGIAYEMKLNLDLLEKANLKVNKLIATGGGANSIVWLQMKADIFNIPIVVLKSNESGSRGAAIIAGVANKQFKNIEEAQKIMNETKLIIKPNIKKHNEYMKVYSRYKKLYFAVKEVL